MMAIGCAVAHPIPEFLPGEPTPNLFGLDARGLHHLRPALQLGLDEIVELFGRTADHVGRLRAGDRGVHRRRLEHLVEDVVDARRQRRVHAGGGNDAVPEMIENPGSV